jgi:hypothetical protein
VLARTADDDVTLYSPPDRPWDLKLRSKHSFKDRLEDVVRLWKMMAEARGDDADQIDVSYVIRRILEAGVDQAFAEYGGQPKSDESWAAVESTIKKTVKKSR